MFPNGSKGLWLPLGALLALSGWAARDARAGTTRPAYGEAPAPRDYPHPEMLTESGKLAQWIGGPEVRERKKILLIDARSREAYRREHLPGARNVESDLLQEPQRPPYYLPTPERLARLAARLGLRPGQRVVLYDANGGRLAARVWFTFWAYGFDEKKLSLLNGGLKKWKDEKRPLSRTRPSPPRKGASWKPAAHLRGVCALGELKRFRPGPIPPGRIPPSMLLDARTYQEYMGDDVRAKLGGHIPGAVNIPWDALLRPVAPRHPKRTQGYFVWRSAPRIHALLRAACLVPKQPLAVYCQSGGRAAHLLFTLHLMGYTQALDYVGSWREYGNRNDVEIEK